MNLMSLNVAALCIFQSYIECGNIARITGDFHMDAIKRLKFGFSLHKKVNC